MPELGLILLAAGGSARMGEPKQLLDFAGTPLVRRAAETALASTCRPVLVVLGAHAAKVQSALAGLPIELVLNQRWEEGVGTSIRAGVETARKRNVDGVVVMLADQPRVTAGMIDRLVAVSRSSRSAIVASRYAETVGVPAFFARELFQRLCSLAPDEGCKRILRDAGDRAVFLDCPEAESDVDTPADYLRLRGAEVRGPAFPGS